MADQKQCYRCKQILEVIYFGKDKQKKDGLRTYCKKCENTNKYQKRHLDIEETRRKIHDYRYKDITKTKQREKVNRRKTYLLHREAYLKRSIKKNLTYRVENKDKILESRRNYRLKNLEKEKEYSRKYIKIYRLRFPDKIKNYLRNRRAKVAGSEGTHTAQEVQYLKEIQDFTCLKCGKKEPEIKLTFDHIVPISKGGGNGIGNGQMLCWSCNSSKQAKFIDFRGTKLKRIKP